ASYDLLNDNGLIYLSFVEGDPEKSDFKVGSGGRVYFYYHKLDDITSQLNNFKFGEIEIVKVKYKISETAFDTHTIVMAKKKNP
ncbi:MAG TPA: class I SAM-dependent methyltransferase, partial [Bacteroidia bacterium]|nr:class I SAM-dependent methyltransferase [Bacteroidia bacterium]